MQRTTLLVLGVLVATVAGRYVPVKKYSEYTKSDGEEYALGIGQVTAFGGLLLWVLYMLVESCCCCYCCFKGREKQIASLRRLQTYQEVLSTRVAHRDPKARGFFIGSLFLVAGLLASSLSVYFYSSSAGDSFVTVYHGIEGGVSDLATFLCSDVSGSNCVNDSAGSFLDKALNLTDSVLNDANSFLTTLQELPDGIVVVLDDAAVAATLAIDIADNVDWIGTNASAIATAIKNLATDYSDINLSPVTDYSVPSVPSSVSSSITEAETILQKGIDLCAQVQDDIETYYTSTIVSIKDQIDGNSSTGSTDDRISVVDIVNNIKDDVVDAKDRVLGGLHTLQNAQVEYYTSVAKESTSAFWAIPVVLLLATTIMAFSLKHTAPVYCDMTCICFLQLIFCVFTGFLMLFYFINKDVCAYNLELMKLNVGNETITVNGYVVNIANSIEDVLYCGYGDGDSNANLAGVLNIESAFDVSSYVDPIVSDIKQIQNFIVNETVYLNQSIPYISSYETSLLSAINLTIYTFNDSIQIGISDCNTVLSTLPEVDMGGNRDDTSQQTKVKDVYFLSDSTFWTEYQTALDALNTQTKGMAKAAYPMPADFTFNFTQVQYLTTTVLNSDAWADSNGDGVSNDGQTFYNGTSYSTVKSKATTVYDYTTSLNTVLTKNTAIVDDIDSIKQSLLNIDSCLLRMRTDSIEIVQEAESIEDDIQLVVEDILDASDSLSVQLVNVERIVSFLLSTPNYLHCSFIGQLYVETYQTQWCETGLNHLNAAYVPMIAITVLWALVFILSAIYIPQLLVNQKHIQRTKFAMTTAENADNSYDNHNPLYMTEAQIVTSESPRAIKTPEADSMDGSIIQFELPGLVRRGQDDGRTNDEPRYHYADTQEVQFENPMRKGKSDEERSYLADDYLEDADDYVVDEENHKDDH